MAELLIPSKTRRGGVPALTKGNPRVDLTPMVDLGFLLITFFIFTINLSSPRSFQMLVPADGDSSEAPLSKTLNVVLVGGNKAFYYYGNEMGKLGCTDFSTQGIRKVILELQAKLTRDTGDASGLVVLIRPGKESSYGNLVDVLDEIVITNVKKYALMGEPPAELLAKALKNSPC